MPVPQRQVEHRHSLLDRLADARANTDQLFSIVRPEALYARPIPERHRIIFYIGHLEAFDWNLLHERALGLPPFQAKFDRLFAFGIDPVGGGLPTDRPEDWPAIGEVRSYVEQVRTAIDEGLEEHLTGNESLGADLTQLLEVAIEHRLMHVETLAYMLHQLPIDRKIRPTASPEVVAAPVVPEMMEIPAGKATLGLHRESGAFGWDNEFESHVVEVPRFSIDRYKVTNRQFLEFLQAAGYEDRSFWSEAAWAWKQEHGISHPGFWRPDGDSWLQRTMFQEIPPPLDWPVYVSHAEASAYARWAGKTLPSESEWHRAAYGGLGGNEQDYPWGSDQPSSKHGNFDFQRWDPTSVGAHPEGKSAFGVVDMLGNGWEWTSTLFAPFPGFEPFPFYLGYSADFFDNKHFVMKGGSPRTAACMLRRSFRNWFQPHYPYVYAGFRCVSH